MVLRHHELIKFTPIVSLATTKVFYLILSLCVHKNFTIRIYFMCYKYRDHHSWFIMMWAFRDHDPDSRWVKSPYPECEMHHYRLALYCKYHIRKLRIRFIVISTPPTKSLWTLAPARNPWQASHWKPDNSRTKHPGLLKFCMILYHMALQQIYTWSEIKRVSYP